MALFSVFIIDRSYLLFDLLRLLRPMPPPWEAFPPFLAIRLTSSLGIAANPRLDEPERPERFDELPPLLLLEEDPPEFLPPPERLELLLPERPELFPSERPEFPLRERPLLLPTFP